MHVYVYNIVILLDGLMDRHKLIQYTHACYTLLHIRFYFKLAAAPGRLDVTIANWFIEQIAVGFGLGTA